VRGIAMGKNVPGFLRPASEFLPPSDRGRGGGGSSEGRGGIWNSARERGGSSGGVVSQEERISRGVI
jgi:hypothetical protein